jgi:predicted nucleotidyltransferase
LEHIVLIDRKKTAYEIINTISKSIPSAEVSLRGSVLSGRDDELSDIDILVEHEKMTDSDVANSVINCLKKTYKVLFEDWAKGFLPKECVVTFFFEGFPLHCFVEVAIIVPEKYRKLSPELISQKFPDHYLKMWAIASKKYSRGIENFELSYLTHHILKSKVEEVGSPYEALKNTFFTFSADSKDKYPSLCKSCKNYIESIEQVH